MDFTLNLTWPILYNYTLVYKIWIQYTNLFKSYETETIFQSRKKGHNSQNYRWILLYIKLDLHFMIICLCIKFQSNTPILTNPKISHGNHLCYVRDRTDVHTDSGDTICPPTENGGGIIKMPCPLLIFSQSDYLIHTKSNADPHQLASEEAKWSGSTLFSKAGHIWVQ